MDWQIDRAIELGIISEDKATEEMQSKLEQFEEDCIESNINAQPPIDHYPKTMLEMDHENIVNTIKNNNNDNIKQLEREINKLNNCIDNQRNYIYKLEKQLRDK